MEYTIVFLDQTYCQNQDNSQKIYHKRGTKNTIIKPTEKISISGVGIQAINGNSFIDFLENTKTYEMMKFMINIVIENLTNKKLINKLTKIVNNKELELKNILNTVNKESNDNILLKTLEDLASINKTINELYLHVKNNKFGIKTKSKIKLENLHKAMLLSLFYDKELQYELIMEKPIAVILDNYKVHHAIVFTKLCNSMNIDLIYLPPYSAKYNLIEQVGRTIKSIISRKYIDTIEDLVDEFKTEFYGCVDNLVSGKNGLKKYYWMCN